MKDSLPLKVVHKEEEPKKMKEEEEPKKMEEETTLDPPADPLALPVKHEVEEKKGS